MQQKVKFAQIRTLGEVVDDSILFFKQNWKSLLRSYFFICGFFWVAGLIIAGFNETNTFKLKEAGESIFSLTYFLTLLFSFLNIVVVLITTFSFIILYHEKDNMAPAVDEVWAYVQYYFLRVLGSAFLLTIAAALGLVLCVIPGIYLIPVFFIVVTVMVLENGSLSYAFRRSFQLVKNNWGYTFGVLIVTSFIVGAAIILFIIPVIIIVVTLLYLTTVNRDHTISMAITLTVHALQILYLLPAISLAFVYFNLNEVKDDNSLMQRIEMLGTNNEDLNNLPSEEY